MRRHLAPLALLAGLALASWPVAAADTIRVAVLPYLSQAPLFIALEEGLFAQAGIAVEQADLRTTQPVVPGIMSGEFDLALATPHAGFFNAVARGGEGRIVAPGLTFSAGSCSYAVFYGREGIDRAALTGGEPRSLKVVADSQGFDHFLADLMRGLPGARGLELEILEMPPAALGEALAAGSVDLAFVGEPWITRLDDAGHGQLTMAGQEILPEAQFGAVLFSSRLTRAEPRLGARVHRVMAAAIARYSEGKTARNLEILAKYTGLSQEFLTRACWAHYPADGVVRTPSLMAYQEWLLARGVIDRVLPPEELVAEVGKE